jgi:hypothetical protein
MINNFPTCNDNNPLEFFDFIYSNKGQLKFKLAFFNELRKFDAMYYHLNDNDFIELEIDLRVFKINYEIDEPYYSEAFEDKISYASYLKNIMNIEAKHFLLKIRNQKRFSVDSILLKKKFAKYNSEIDKYILKVNISNYPLKSNHLRFLNKLKKQIDNMFNDSKGILIDVSEHGFTKFKTGFTKPDLDKIYSVLQELECIDCDKPLFNYWFNFEKNQISITKPKIVWKGNKNILIPFVKNIIVYNTKTTKKGHGKWEHARNVFQANFEIKDNSKPGNMSRAKQLIFDKLLKLNQK